MPKKDPNPHRRPATMADVEKAKREATDQAIYAMTLICLYVLHDKFNFTDEQVDNAAYWINSTADSVLSGALKLQDIKSVLDTEYGYNTKGGK